MLIVYALLAAGPITFHDQPLPGIRIGPPTPFTGRPATNFLHADLDGDGEVEIILPGAIWFQERGRYPEELRRAWPGSASEGEADVAGREVFLRTPNHLFVYTWADEGWRESIDQPLDWPGVHPPAAGPPGPSRRLFRRFAHDLDGDGIPELVDLDSTGVHVFQRRGDRYEPAGLLPVLPAATPAPSATQAIWPETARRIVLPDESLSCRLLIAGSVIDVLSATPERSGYRQYRRERIQIEPGPEGGYTAGRRTSSTSGTLPPHVRPCYLNQDTVPDYAGGRWDVSGGSAVPIPIYETWASTDGGETFHIERAPAFQHARPLCSFVDFDGDGAMDLVTESTPFYARGARETFNRYLTESRLQHLVHIRRQDAGSFSGGPVLTHAVTIELGAPPISGGKMLDRYRAGQIVNITGDFNGDGCLDLAARTSATSLEVFLARGWEGFHTNAAATIAIPEHGDFSVADINGNGRADVLVSWEPDPGSGEAPEVVAYFTGPAPP
ncbi:MAG: VCBS repeat-containing protein [Candidatus Hydrogenedentes bacterium]|nr:VCBS repeat-containing protein [Candidatus Hydrogenedentota bacterium]